MSDDDRPFQSMTDPVKELVGEISPDPRLRLQLPPSRLSFAEIDRLMGEDPDDREIREAHGFTYDDDFQDRSLLCRNGCGATYYDIAAGKIRECLARAEGEHDGT